MSSSNSQTGTGMYSVCIPTINAFYKEQEVRYWFGCNNIGDVMRVDFAPILNEEKKEFRQAFVHFKPLYKTDLVLNSIEKDGSYRLYLRQEFRSSFSPDLPKKVLNEYWILLKNTAPVPETEQNIHQLAHNAKLMEEREIKMEERMAKMEAKMLKMEEREILMEMKMEQMRDREGQLDSMVEELFTNIAKMETKIEQMEERESQMEERESQMEQMRNRAGEMDTMMMQIHVNMTKMEMKMEDTIELNTKMAKIVEVQGINIQILSKSLDMFSNKADLIKEGFENEINNLKTDCDDRYWRFSDKFDEKLAQYARDTKWLFDSSSKEIEKVMEKNDKINEDIQFCIDQMYRLKSNLGHTEDRISRIMDVIYYLTEKIAGKDGAELKFNLMKFNDTGCASSHSLPLSIDDLV
jgi:hypothetical protein